MPKERGISVVIPSRNGRALVETCLGTISAQAVPVPYEIIIVDNGSDDGTAAWLAKAWPRVRTVVEAQPLSFARAVNRGIAVARYSHVCLMNNDMVAAPGFFAALWDAFAQVPNLFCATAQIRFPAGVRREETGKAVMAADHPDDFPVRCDEPVEGEDLTWVLYGSGGCSLYDGAKLATLGNVDEAYEPAYVEDMDLGWRGWQQGWPTVYVAGALVEHRHRATTSRYYTARELDRVLEINYLKFLVRAVDSPTLFRRLWGEAVGRLSRTGRAPGLRAAAGIALEGGSGARVRLEEELFLALTDGSVAVFPGSGTGIMMATCSALAAPPAAWRSEFAGIVLVRSTRDSTAYRAAHLMAERRWPGATVKTAETLAAPM